MNKPRRGAAPSVSRPARHAPASLPPDDRHAKAPPPASAVPDRKPGYVEAVGLYERGLEALQRREFVVASGLFQDLLDRFPDERELHERVRLYLKVCERETGPREATPKTLEERIYAATLALNAGTPGEALSHLLRVHEEDPENDHAQYMLAVAYAQKGEALLALDSLARAIALNPENRAIARHDPDLEPIRSEEGFRTALETPAPEGARRRPKSRPAR
jgi:tetratricopeptide (TPR) repeat protein